MFRVTLPLALGFAALSFSTLAVSLPSRPIYPSFTAKKAVIVKFKLSNISTVPDDINDAGTITGITDKKAGAKVFVRAQNGTTTLFGISGVLIVNALINDAGVVAGAYSDSTSVTHGFVRGTDRKVTKFDFPQPTGGTIVAINASGVVLGQYYTKRGDTAAFVRAPDGTIKTFRIGGDHSVAGGTSTIARGMNDSGTIVGSCFRSDLRKTLGFVRTADGSVVRFDAGSFETDPMAINASGAVVGVYYDHDDNEQGFIRSPSGVILQIRVLNALQTIPVAIDAAGAVTGTYEDGKGQFHDFVRDSGGNFTFFDIARSLWSEPVAINSSGVVVGLFNSEASVREGFVRTP